MSAEYVRGYYGVDFKIGERMLFDYDGRVGTLMSFPNQYLGIRFDGDKHTSRVHPLEARRLSDGTNGREVHHMSAPIPLAEAGVRGVRLHFELPRALVLNANDRMHWAVKARVTKDLRQMGRLAAHGLEPMERAHLTVRVGWPTKHRRDVANLISIKPLLDGAVDVGLLPDDDDKHLIGPDLRPYLAGRPGLIVLDFEFIEVA